MVSTGGGIAIAVVVLAIAAVVGWVVFTQLRARRLGLPPPSLGDYLPWRKRDSPYGAPSPAPGGVVGWMNDLVRKFKNRNNRSATGAYEPSHPAGSGRRGFGPLDPDEAWDARVNTEADGYGGYEEREMDSRRGNTTDLHGRDEDTEYGGGSYAMNLAGPYGREDDEERGRRMPAQGGRNPFDDDAGSSLRGVSPRPMDGDARHSVDAPSERRSAFRENV